MAHFAKLDENNVVLSVEVVMDSDCLDESNNESEAVGITFLTNLTGHSNWKQTSYNNNIRKRYALLGGTYDPTNDVFIPPKPHASWTLNSDHDWVAPINEPSDAGENKSYTWDETLYQGDNSKGWVEFIATDADKA